MSGEDRLVYGKFAIDGYVGLHVRAGKPKRVRVVPPAGEDYAFDRDDYPLIVEVSVSPTGRSARVWVNGAEVKPA